MSTGILRGDRVPVTSPVTPTPKGRHVAMEAEGDVTGDASGLGSQTVTPDKPLQPDIDIYGSRSQTEDMHQAQTQSHFEATSRAIPFRLPASTGQPQGSRDGDPFSDTGLYEAMAVTRSEQETDVTASTDVVDEEAVSSSRDDAGQARDSAMNDFAPNVFDQEPLGRPHENAREKHGAPKAASVSNTTEKESKKLEAAVLEAVDEDMPITSIPQPHHQSPTHSFTFDSQPPSPKGRQVVHAPAGTPSDSPPATSILDAVNGLVTITIPPHYSLVRDRLWSIKLTAEAETRAAPRTPSPKKRPRAASGTSAKRRKRTPKNPPKAAVATSPALTRSAKKKALEAPATRPASPAPRPTSIKRIVLHFTRKPKIDTDGEAAPEPEPEQEEESGPESSEPSDQPGTRDPGCYGSDADELDTDKDEDEDADGKE